MNEKITPPVLITDLGTMFPTEMSKEKKRFGIYKCQCGIEFKAQTAGVKNGHTQSCGCYNKQRVSETKTTHGLKNHRLYGTWKLMIYRTSNPKYNRYKDYGGRGIRVCERWLKVENFIEDMYPSFTEGLTIDRKDNDKGYSPDNCRWASNETQKRNRRLIQANNKSGYRGVCFIEPRGEWLARIMVNGKRKNLGSFNTALEAAIAYDTYVVVNDLEHTLNGVLQ